MEEIKEPRKLTIVQILRTRCGCERRMNPPISLEEAAKHRYMYCIKVPLKESQGYRWNTDPIPTTGRIAKARTFRYFGETEQLGPDLQGWIFGEVEEE